MMSRMRLHRMADRYGGGDDGDDGAEVPSFCSWFLLMYRFSNFIYIDTTKAA